jgi:hypothetical protein
MMGFREKEMKMVNDPCAKISQSLHQVDLNKDPSFSFKGGNNIRLLK